MPTEKTTHATTILCKTALLLKDDVISGKIVNWYETGDPLTVPMLKKIIKVAEQFRLDQAATPPHAWGTFLHEHETPGDAFFFRTLDLDDRFEDSAFPGSIQRMVRSLSSYDVMYTELKRLVEEKASQSANKSGDKELIKNALEALDDFCRAYAFFNASAYAEILNAAVKEDHLLMKSTVMAYAANSVIDVADINTYQPSQLCDKVENYLLTSILDFMNSHMPNHAMRNGFLMKKLQMNRNPRVFKSWIDRFGIEDHAKPRLENLLSECFDFDGEKLVFLNKSPHKNKYWQNLVSAHQSLHPERTEKEIEKTIMNTTDAPKRLMNIIALYPERFPLEMINPSSLFEIYELASAMCNGDSAISSGGSLITRTSDDKKQVLRGLPDQILKICPDLIWEAQIEEGINWKTAGIDDESYWKYKENSAHLEREHIFHHETKKLNLVAEQARGTRSANSISKRGIRKV